LYNVLNFGQILICVIHDTIANKSFIVRLPSKVYSKKQF